jgi:hypothetical protein
MSRSTARDVLALAAQPVLLVAAAAVFALTGWCGWKPDAAIFLFQFSVLGLLLVLESVIRYNPAWWPDRREWGHCRAHLRLAVAAARRTPRSGGKVNVANNGVNHVADVVISQGFVQLALALVGFSGRAVFGVGLFTAAQGYFVHADIRVRLGPFNHALAGPEQHRLHHSTDLSEAGHYGCDLSLWDRLFGTFTWHPGREPTAVGLADPRAFPATGRILATLVHPWRRSAG